MFQVTGKKTNMKVRNGSISEKDLDKQLLTKTIYQQKLKIILLTKLRGIKKDNALKLTHEGGKKP